MTGRSYQVQELAERFGLELQGAGSTLIHGVGTLEGATAGQISFLSNPVYRKHLARTAASAVIVRRDDAAIASHSYLIASDPYVAFARIAALFEGVAERIVGVHASALVDGTATVAASACIGPWVSIGARSVIGDRAIIAAGCVIGEDCVVGADSELLARVTLVCRVRLGQRVRVHPGAVLGAEGFGLAMDGGHWIKVPQSGGVQIGDDCEIGANTTIDRGAIDVDRQSDPDRTQRPDWCPHRDGRLRGDRGLNPDRALLPDRWRRRNGRPHRGLRQGAGHGNEPGYPFDHRTWRIFIGHADPAQPRLAAQRGTFQAS